MQLLKTALISAAVVGVLAVLIHEYSSEIRTFLSRPVFLTAFLKIQSIISDVFPTSDPVRSDSSHQKAKKTRNTKEKLLTPEELKQFDGSPGSKGLYLAVLGLVYNVKKGKKHYGPGGGYEFFAGCDASRAFVTGDFTEAGLIDDISGLAAADYIGLDEWIKFYQNDYKYVGKLIGRYYDEKGERTSYNNEAQKWIAEAYRERESENVEKKIFPPCNSEWSPDSGARVWCTAHSGGVDREWVGVPRKLYTPGQGRARCACVRDVGPPSHDPQKKEHDDRGDLDNPNLEEYAGCYPEEPFCYITDD